MTWFEAFLLGAIQGVAEFLPISSSGHLALAEILLGIANDGATHRFNIAVHFGTLMAVLVTYRKDLHAIIARGREAGPERALALAVIVATLPLAFAVLPQVETLVIAIEGSTKLLGVAFLVTGGLLALSHLIERQYLAGRTSAPSDGPLPNEARAAGENDEASRHWPPTLRRALAIGTAQLLAVTPGVSRSGTTMAAGLIAGLNREDTARFSFLLAIPAIAAASLKEVVDALGEATRWSSDDIAVVIIGVVVSFVVGLLSLRLLIEVIRQFGLLPFVPYLLMLGLVSLFLL